MPRGDASQSATTALDNGRASAKSAPKRAALARRDNAADAGQVLEYSTENPIAKPRWPSRNSASSAIGYRFQPALALASADRNSRWS